MTAVVGGEPRGPLRPVPAAPAGQHAAEPARPSPGDPRPADGLLIAAGSVDDGVRRGPRDEAGRHAGQERPGLIEPKIRQLPADIAKAEVNEQSKVAKGVVVFGKAVKLKDLADGSEETYTLVGPHEADFDQGMISVESPIGKGLLGKKVGDIAEIQVPAGTIKYKVLSIT